MYGSILPNASGVLMLSCAKEFTAKPIVRANAQSVLKDFSL
ncbi:hypothetical protein QW060_20365 [Myroides ceti]|uniref:Uncharacterized protein n=1 Tax=Paenimyroides ceti TaxID=395087 RepID=A0ABT8CXV9_9FLAO|nr:hypothetical protein [Paenimyroides ceti]MDN3709367.1 hypothetical protein [Paenimyroides ceti]